MRKLAVCSMTMWNALWLPTAVYTDRLHKRNLSSKFCSLLSATKDTKSTDRVKRAMPSAARTKLLYQLLDTPTNSNCQWLGENREIFHIQASRELLFHNYRSLINENGLPVFDGENFLVRATNFHFLSIPPKSFHFSSDLSRMDAMGR